MAKNVDEDLVSTYFYLQKRIDRATRRIGEYEYEFNNKNFYTCTQMRHEEMTTVAFKLEKEVISHVVAIEMAEQHIKTLQFKLKHFDRFMNGLSSSDKEYYISRYKYNYEALNDRLDKLIFEEVSEIEEATAYYFKLDKARFYFKVSKEEIEEVVPLIDPDKTEEEKNTDFSNMLEVLGL